MKMHRIAAVITAAVLAAGGLAACGSSSEDNGSGSASSAPSSASPSAASPSATDSPTTSATPSASATPAAAALISIKDYRYSGTTKVAPGTKVMVKNLDSEAHTVSSDSGSAFDVNVLPGKTASFTAPGKAGAYPFHCTYHANMHGSLTVG